MSKTQTLTWAIILVGSGIFCLMIGLGLALSPACFVVAAGFGLRCAFQFMRDYGLAHRVEEHTQDQALIAPPKTSPGSGRLYVP